MGCADGLPLNFSQLFDLLTISKSRQSTFLFADRPLPVILNRTPRIEPPKTFFQSQIDNRQHRSACAREKSES
jgi:hypothetical protein